MSIYPTFNLFSRNGVTDGTVIGVSNEIIGQDLQALVSFSNPGGATVVMEQQNINNPVAWSAIGSIYSGAGQHFRMRLTAGWRFRFRVLSSGTMAIDTSVSEFNSARYTADHFYSGGDSDNFIYSDGFPDLTNGSSSVDHRQYLPVWAAGDAATYTLANPYVLGSNGDIYRLNPDKGAGVPGDPNTDPVSTDGSTASDWVRHSEDDKNLTITSEPSLDAPIPNVLPAGMPTGSDAQIGDTHIRNRKGVVLYYTHNGTTFEETLRIVSAASQSSPTLRTISLSAHTASLNKNNFPTDVEAASIVTADTSIDIGDPVVLINADGFQFFTRRTDGDSGTMQIVPLIMQKPPALIISSLPDPTTYPPGFVIEVEKGVDSGTYEVNDSGTNWETTDRHAAYISAAVNESNKLHNFNTLTAPFAKSECPFDGTLVTGTTKFTYTYPEALAAFTAMNAAPGDTGVWKTPIGGHEWIFTLHEDNKVTADWPSNLDYFFTSDDTSIPVVLTALSASDIKAGFRWREIDQNTDGNGVLNWIAGADGVPYNFDGMDNGLIDNRDRIYNIIDADTTFSAASVIRGKMEISALLKDNSITATFDVAIPEDSAIEIGVHRKDDSHELMLTSSDPSTVKFRDNRLNTANDGQAVIKVETDAVFLRKGNFFDQIRGRCACMPDPVALSVNGSFDESDPYQLLINVDEATGGSGTYDNYEIVLSFIHSDQSARELTLSGALTDAPSISGFSGTLGSLVIDNRVADIYGQIDMLIEVTDNQNDSALGNVVSTSENYAISKIMFDHDGTGGPNGTIDPLINKLHFSTHQGEYDFGNGQTGIGLNVSVTPTGAATNAYVSTPTWTFHKLFMLDDGVTRFDLASSSLLDTLNTNGNATPDLDLEENKLLRVVSAQSTGLINVTLPVGGIISQAFLNNNAIANIDLSGRNTLTYINIAGNPIAVLDITDIPLTYLACNFCPNIDYVDLTGQSALNTLFLDVCSITQANLALMLSQLDSAHTVGSGKYIKVSGQSTGAVIDTGTPEAASADSLTAKGFEVVSDGTWNA